MRSALLSAGFAISCSEAAPAPTSFTLVSKGGAVQADVSFEGGVKRGENQLLARLSTSPAEAQAVLESVLALMPHHNHQAPPPTISGVDEGYRVEELNLFMTGRWLVELEIALDDRADRVSFPVDVP